FCSSNPSCHSNYYIVVTMTPVKVPYGRDVRPAAAAGSADAGGTSRRMIEAALGAIHQYGYRNASSNKIAEHAGVSWGVIQYHFGTRERLLLAVLKAAIDDVDKRIDAIHATLPGRTF